MTLNSVLKGTIKSLIAISITMISGISISSESKDQIPENIITRAASNTFSTQKYTKEELNKRHSEVKQFVELNGGNAWYESYKKSFGAPTSRELLMTPNVDDISGKKLGAYYVHRPYDSVEQMIEIDCHSSPRNSNSAFQREAFMKTITMKEWCALSSFNAWLVFGSKPSLKRFSEIADWLLGIQEDGKWVWTTDIPARDLKAPWISGLSQSLGISILLRQFQLTNDQKYLDGAKRALEWLNRPVADGGVRMDVEGGVWYEEYPNAQQPSHVLNGHIWALFGVLDYYRVTGDDVAHTMFKNGVTATAKQISKYDVMDWSVYAQSNQFDLVTGEYQAFIVSQLIALHAVTGIEDFRTYGEKWKESQNNGWLFSNLVANEFVKAQKGKTP
ncbi:D-glucuronyl C5-epimerase family protein [Pseudomonas sp. CR3202]|uniref:D-glucuronyl C5-epimerase family protein n=1 Tax=Pseudomonas sp. CR3202 TaxID=3351532 RepID=UPI003BF0D5CD